MSSLALESPSLGHCDRQALRPFDRREALTVVEAAQASGRPPSTIYDWIDRYHIGRRVCGRSLVSAPALHMLLDGREDLLRLYLAGDRASPGVMAYFERLGIPTPHPKELETS